MYSPLDASSQWTTQLQRLGGTESSSRTTATAIFRNRTARIKHSNASAGTHLKGLQRGVGWLIKINAERDSLWEAYIGFVVRHNGEHPCASRLSPSALSPLPGWHGRKPCRRTKTRTNLSPAPAARLLPRRRVSCNRKAGPARSTLSLLAALLPQAHKVRPRRACRPRQKVRRRQSSSLTRNSKRSPDRANRDSGLKSEPSTAFTMCFSAGSRRRSARQGSELINPGEVPRSRQFTSKNVPKKKRSS